MRDKDLVPHVEFQFLQSHLLKILSLLQCIFWHPYKNLGNCDCMDIYLSKYHFYSIDLCVCVCTNIMLFLSLWLYVHFYIRCGFSTQSILLVHICFDYPWYFVHSNKSCFFSISEKNKLYLIVVIREPSPRHLLKESV